MKQSHAGSIDQRDLIARIDDPGGGLRSTASKGNRPILTGS